MAMRWLFAVQDIEEISDICLGEVYTTFPSFCYWKVPLVLPHGCLLLYCHLYEPCSGQRPYCQPEGPERPRRQIDSGGVASSVAF